MEKIKPLAIYLPQYHPIPENDKAWGDGFTEWTNVKKAQPLFEGHYQPHVPHESVGYYDLRDPEVMVRQAAMAKEYGIYGFAFYHYWFNGKRLLETPLDNMLKTGKPDFPFCYIWANENWTKRWDGLDNEIIIKQDYSIEDDIAHIEFLCKNVFSDKRYITIDGKPIFIVYRTELFPNIKNTVKVWQKIVKSRGFKGLYLIRVENFVANINPKSIGFDAAMEFAPNWHCRSNSLKNSALDYPTTVLNTVFKRYNYKTYRSVFPSWDNTARKGVNSLKFVNCSVEMFQYYVLCIKTYTKIFNKKTPFFFINAWNEWGEGCHIEPDISFGFAHLNATMRALDDENVYVNSYYKIGYWIFKLKNLLRFVKLFDFKFNKRFLN